MSTEADAIKGLYFPCLDHGFVALKDYMGGDAEIEEAARVSYQAGTRKVSDMRGLVRYLLRHKHTTPFEMVELKFHVKLPIFVARQLIRHRTANVNEYSMRYSLPAMQFYVPHLGNMGTQSKKNRQGRAEPVPAIDGQTIQRQWVRLQSEAKELYELCIAEDIDLARELARMHLPLSIYTEWYWKIDLHNCLHFLKLRCDPHAQWEIQQVSNIKAAICKLVAPLAFEAWIDYSFQSRTFSRMEMQLLRRLIGTSVSDPYSAPKHTHVGISGGDWKEADATKLGMSKREWEDFMATFDRVLTPDLYEPKKFELDMSTAMPGSYFEDQAAQYLPKGG